MRAGGNPFRAHGSTARWPNKNAKSLYSGVFDHNVPTSLLRARRCSGSAVLERRLISSQPRILSIHLSEQGDTDTHETHQHSIQDVAYTKMYPLPHDPPT